MSSLKDLAPYLSDRDHDARALAQMTVQGLASSSSRRNYSRYIQHFLECRRPLTREGVQAHLAGMRETGKGPVTLNVALAAIRLFAREAQLRGQLSDQELTAIERIKSLPVRGQRTGNWLDVLALKRLLEAAAEGGQGIRNAALVAVMAGCGLRRAEVCGLTWDQWQRREGRWCWIDVKGKGGRIRTVPCPEWAAELVERWRKSL